MPPSSPGKPLSKFIGDEAVNGLQWLYLRRGENRDAISSVTLQFLSFCFSSEEKKKKKKIYSRHPASRQNTGEDRVRRQFNDTIKDAISFTFRSLEEIQGVPVINRLGGDSTIHEEKEGTKFVPWSVSSRENLEFADLSIILEFVTELISQSTRGYSTQAETSKKSVE